MSYLGQLTSWDPYSPSTLVRSRLEYCVQAWRPYLVKDIEFMEKVQKRVTRMLPDLKNMSYPERLKKLGLTILESRRLRGDLIEVFKILKSHNNVDRNMFFFTETLEFVGGIVKNYISILLRSGRPDISPVFF